MKGEILEGEDVKEGKIYDRWKKNTFEVCRVKGNVPLLTEDTNLGKGRAEERGEEQNKAEEKD